MVGLALLMMTALAGVGFAAQNFIQCPKITPQDGYCDGTNKDDVMEGTSNDDYMRAGPGVDIMYGRGGTDALYGNEGPDVAYGGPGDDNLRSDCDADYWCGRDEKHGGPGDDLVVGNLMSEKHYGGRGSDTITDYKSIKRPDAFRCGPGHDEVLDNKGLDKVAADCEVLTAARPINESCFRIPLLACTRIIAGPKYAAFASSAAVAVRNGLQQILDTHVASGAPASA